MKKIFIHHPSLDKELDSIFNLKEGFDNRDTNTLFKDLKDYFYEKGYSLSNSCGLNPNDADLILFYDISRSDPFFDRLKKEIKRKKLKTKLGVILFEPPIINKAQYSVSKLKYFDIVFTWKSDLVDNEKIFKYYWPEKFIGDPPFNRPFNNKKFICMVNANKLAVGKNELYSERKKAIKFFENTKEGIEVYGSGWNEKKLNFSVIGHIFLRCGFLLKSFICLDFKLFIFLLEFIFNLNPLKSQTVKGFSKKPSVELLSNYKFSICFENAKNIPGYSTEKIFNSLNARCIPIYLGDKEILEHIPSGCYIDMNKFKDYNSLYNYLTSLTKEDYETYMSNINNFLSEGNKGIYSNNNFVKTIYEGFLKIK